MPRDKARIAVDAMGGDYAPVEIVAGAVQAAMQSPNLEIILVGQEDRVGQELHKLGGAPANLRIVHATQIAGMDEKPTDILRRKKDSSLQVAFRLVKDGKADGVISAGNSGAVLACGIFILGRIEGIERPALASFLPTEAGRTVLIDSGANVDCKPHHLAQFGVMANVVVRDVLGKPKPKIGLLSIGEEEGKGNQQVKEAFEFFRRSSTMNFIGNVEGRDIFSGKVDIVVCDGFVGNVALKLSEGLGTSLTRILKRELKHSLITKFGAMLSYGAFKRLARLVDYAEYGGAPLLGLKGTTIVCHGASSAKAIKSAINMTAALIANKSGEHLIKELADNAELAMFNRRAPSGQAAQE